MYFVSNMKTLRSLFIISLFNNGVFGDTGEVETVSVMEGDSLTLHTDLTHIQTRDVLLWSFGDKQDRIGRIIREDSEFSTYNGTDGRFRDKLKLNNQTGDLTITNIRTEHSGVYHLKVIGVKTTTKTFNVSALESSSDGVKMVSVMKRDSVILHTDITEIQRDDVIVWRFGPQHTILAEINKTSDTYNVDGKFGDRLYLNHQNGDLTIRHISNDAYGLYSLQITRSGKSFTIHKSFNVTESGAGVSSGVTAGICVSLLLLVVAAGVAGVIYCRRRLSKVKEPLDTCKVITVNEGQSYTLHTHVTEIHTDDVIEWRFGDEETLIAKIHKKNDISRTYDDGDEDLFKNTLELKDQTGDLTIKNITNKHSGVYTLKTIRGEETSYRRFQVSVTDSVEINQPLMNRDSEQQ